MDVHRAGSDDGDLHPGAAPSGEVDQVKGLRRMAPTAYVWLIVGGLYFFIQTWKRSRNTSNLKLSSSGIVT